MKCDVYDHVCYKRQEAWQFSFSEWLRNEGKAQNTGVVMLTTPGQSSQVIAHSSVLLSASVCCSPHHLIFSQQVESNFLCFVSLSVLLMCMTSSSLHTSFCVWFFFVFLSLLLPFEVALVTVAHLQLRE